MRVGTYPTRNFANLRTVIVTAAVHWGFSSKLRVPLTSPLNLPAPGRASALILQLSFSQAPVFLLNSCLGLFSATTSRGTLLLPKLRSHFAEFLNEGSLARLRFLTLPTCVGLRYGRTALSLEAFLGSLGSSASVLIFPPRHVSALSRGDLPPCQPARLDPIYQSRAQTTFLRHSFDLTIPRGTGISTSCPSSTPLGLDLGPDLPWADDPSPGNLRFSADKILTCLFVYYYQHSPLCTLQPASQLTFFAYTMLPYHSCLHESKASVLCFSPVTFSAQNSWTSELLRTLQMVAASEPTSWLSEEFHFLSHLAQFRDLSCWSGLFPF